ncbi:unnamed protein product [Musa banksii]
MSRCNRYIVVYFHLAGVMDADWASHFGYLAYLNDARHCLVLLIVSCYSMFSLLFEPQVLLIKVLLMDQHLCKSQSLNMWSTSWPHWKTFMCSDKDEIFNCDVMFFTLETSIESARNTNLDMIQMGPQQSLYQLSKYSIKPLLYAHNSVPKDSYTC